MCWQQTHNYAKDLPMLTCILVNFWVFFMNCQPGLLCGARGQTVPHRFIKMHVYIPQRNWSAPSSLPHQTDLSKIIRLSSFRTLSVPGSKRWIVYLATCTVPTITQVQAALPSTQSTQDGWHQTQPGTRKRL